VADHPELIDINFGGRHADWNHLNSIDYNEEFDQILLSSHNQNEIWVIDHSTTTEEAAGHTGGDIVEVGIYSIGGVTRGSIALAVQVTRNSLDSMMHSGLNRDALAKEIFWFLITAIKAKVISILPWMRSYLLWTKMATIS